MRIGLADREQAPDRSRRLLVRLAGLGRSARLLHRRARGGHRFEDLALVSRITLDRLDQVGNQIGATLELYVDVRPAPLGLVAEPDEVVEDQDRPDREQNDYSHDDVDDDHDGGDYRAPCRRRLPGRPQTTFAAAKKARPNNPRSALCCPRV